MLEANKLRLISRKRTSTRVSNNLEFSKHYRVLIARSGRPQLSTNWPIGHKILMIPRPCNIFHAILVGHPSFLRKTVRDHVKFQFLKTREAVIELNFKSKALQRRVICRKRNKITMSQALSNQDDRMFDGCSVGSNEHYCQTYTLGAVLHICKSILEMLPDFTKTTQIILNFCFNSTFLYFAELLKMLLLRLLNNMDLLISKQTEFKKKLSQSTKFNS